MDGDNVSYTMAASKWRRSGFVEVVSIHGTPIASFPISFLDTCGDNTWQYVHYGVRLVIEAEPRHAGSIVSDEDLPVHLQDVPTAGTFRYIEEGKHSDINLARGPEYFSHTVAPTGIEESTRSMSSYASRSHPDQAGFREELLIRDGACILTDEVSSLVYDAAHVVPQSRPDVYKELQGDSYGMFEASAGLLLQITYHESYAAFKQKCRYFNPDNETQRSLNGKAIPPDRFRYLDKPDSVLVAWHYAQAVRMRIRGYSVGMVASW